MNKKSFCSGMLVLLFSFVWIQSSADSIQNKTENRESSDKKQILETMLQKRTFVFNATDMFPRGEERISLNYDCDVQLFDSTMISYLPFVGKSYSLNPGKPGSGFDFEQKIEDYEFKEKRKSYQVKVNVKNGSDHLKYTFYVKESGTSVLTVASLHRQSISFYGTIDSRK
jgi:hypothetical protein